MSQDTSVHLWEEDIIIPTYKTYPPEKNPLFIEKRAYQGSSGKVYPLPVTEKISDTKEDMSYHAVYLENEYLKIMILPELGGRIQRAYDKTNNYDFVYYNHVIKPALVGLTGPWISGGIEFNWPQHHRPSTYSPVDYTLSENADGSCTVYVGETDKMYETKGMAAISLYPGKAYIEIRGQLYNPTDLPQSFLWWANPAVPVNDYTFSVFPPDVNAVMDHGKRAVATFPIATGEYYKYDYSAGVDISRYKNIKVPTSYMAAHSDFDFIGNYDENKEAGLLHIADHHISPGKKQWTWGSGDFGKAWDRNLTDADGPYIELMTGVFTDNQPDFTWLKPHEEKTFVQYFMPYKGVGYVGNATKDAAVSLRQTAPARSLLKVYASGRLNDACISITRQKEMLFEIITALSPEECFKTEIPFSTEALKDCVITVTHQNRQLLKYTVYQKKLQPVPSPAAALAAPSELKSLEELYLAALHLEQYRHATYDPADYYLEGLRRDATDIRLNNGYGLLLYRRGETAKSIPHFKAAIKKQTWRNPNPYSGECYFNLGLALERDGQEEAAYDAFYKSTWNAETQSAGFYWLAKLASRRQQYEKALDFLSKSLVYHWHNMKTRALKCAIMRKLELDNLPLIDESLSIDPLYMGCLYEKALHDGSLSSWKQYMRKEAHNYLTLALDYTSVGLYDDAIHILCSCKDDNPLLHYYLGWVYQLKQAVGKSSAAFRKAETCPYAYCFPNKIEEIPILEAAIQALDTAPMAHYYLGNLYYDKKQYQKAIFHWEQAVLLNKDLAPAYRNLAIAYYNKQENVQKAMCMMEKACSLDSAYPRQWLEYDQLAAKMNLDNEFRLSVMDSHINITTSRDDLYLRYITLLNCLGRYEDALDAISRKQFHPWEGGEGKAGGQYKYACIHLAQDKLKEQDILSATALLKDALVYPENLGEGKLPNTPDNEIYYYLGIAYQQLGDEQLAREHFQRAALGTQEPQSVLYYNDQPSDFIFYQGLAFQQLENENAAKKSFHQLIAYGETHLFDHAAYDFFAVSLPEIEVFQDDITLRNTQYCNYLRALGLTGLRQYENARKLTAEILLRQKEHQGAITLMRLINQELIFA